MRKELFYNPRIIVERLAIESQRRRRFARLRGTVASGLQLGHIDSLELLEVAQKSGVSVIYDIGANVGTWTLLAKAILPQAEVHAFEPLEGHVLKFETVMKHIPGVALHRVALGAEEAELLMQVATFSDASSLLEIAPPLQEQLHVYKEREEKVKVVRLDDYIKANGLAPPDLIKLDIQGYELEALKGATEALKHTRHVICEVSFVEFYKGQPLFGEIMQFMTERGFVLNALGINTPLGQELQQTDVLFSAKKPAVKPAG